MSVGNTLNTVDEAPGNNSPTDDKVKLRLHFGGVFVKAAGGCKYEGGETFMESISRTCTYSELVHKLNEKLDSDLCIKYLAPGDELDPENLVSVVDDNDLKEMYEEYFTAQRSAASRPNSSNFRIKIYLSFAMEDEDMMPEDFEEETLFGQHLEKPISHTAALLEGRSSYGSSLSSSSNPAATHVSDMDPPASQHAFMHSSRVYAIPPAYYGQSRMLSGMAQPKLPVSSSEHGRVWTEQELLERVATSISRQCKDVFMAPTPSVSAHSSQPLVQIAEVGLSTRTEHQAPEAKHLEGHGQPPEEQGVSAFAMASANLGNGWSHAAGSADPDDLAGTTPTLPSHISVFGDAAQRLPSHISAFGDDGYGGLDMELEDAVFKEMREEAHELAEMDDGGFRMKTQEFVADDVAAVSTQPPTPEQQQGMRLHVHPATADALPVPELAAQENKVAGGLPIEMSAVHHVTVTDVQRRLPIGDGAFGEVCRATIPIFGEVAVKWLKAGKFQKHLDNFRKEAAMLAGLNHPNVLRFYGIVTESHDTSDVVGIITEYMRSGSLAQYLRSRVTKDNHCHYLTLRERCQLALHAARGMTYLHEVHVVHFDLKPDNLLLDGEGSSIVVKVADFGLSKHKIKAYVSTCKDLRGTLPYMAPELVSDPERVSEKADVWSMGVVMWEMLTLEVPYRNQAPQQILMGLMTGSVHLDVPEWCEPEWRGLLEACLDTNPSRRPSFKDLATQLERIRDLAA